ncbi:hypothetical protein [Nesterenkonia pannonica]|uniref:hypothetical protein n=1 Tax=Nesterenkonia pannonica TaxID=1548602 RepID=UPI002164D65B|nr:hypothetical protein [Nesterenkonia pannonica]
MPAQDAGDWQLIGTSDADLWNLERGGPGGPALIRPGDRVRYVRAAERIEVAERAPSPPTTRSPMLEVIEPGAQTLIQDVGRKGCANLGLPAPVPPMWLRCGRRISWSAMMTAPRRSRCCGRLRSRGASDLRLGGHGR